MFLAYLYSVPLQRAWCCLTLVWNQKLNEIFSLTRLQSNPPLLTFMDGGYCSGSCRKMATTGSCLSGLQQSKVATADTAVLYSKVVILIVSWSIPSYEEMSRYCSVYMFLDNKTKFLQVHNILLQQIKSCCSTETGGSLGSVVIYRYPGVGGRHEVGIFSCCRVDSA